jgi:hypothetical protein
MARSKPQLQRREAADRELFAQMQKAIDASHHLIWEQFLRAYAAINGNRTAKRFCEKFDEAWMRSLRPNIERSDMDANGDYVKSAA